MVLPKIKVMARLNLKSQPCWKQGPNSDFREARIQPIRTQLSHLEAVLPWTWAKHWGYAQTLLQSSSLRQQELQNQAPSNSKPESKGKSYTRQVPAVLKDTPLPNLPSFCAPTDTSHLLQVKDARDIEIVKDTWGKSMRSPGNLVFPRRKGLCFQRMGTSYFPCGLAKWAQ